MKKTVVVSLNFCSCFSLMIVLQLIFDLILPKMQINRKWIIFDLVISLFIAVIVPFVFNKNDFKKNGKGAQIWLKGAGFVSATAFVCYVTLISVGITKPSGIFSLVIVPILLLLSSCIGFVSAWLIIISIEKRNLEQINKMLEYNNETNN